MQKMNHVAVVYCLSSSLCDNYFHLLLFGALFMNFPVASAIPSQLSQFFLICSSLYAAITELHECVEILLLL